MKFEVKDEAKKVRLCSSDPAYCPPSPKRKGDAWVKFEGEPEPELTHENLAVHDAQTSTNSSPHAVFHSQKLPLVQMVMLLIEREDISSSHSRNVAIFIIHLIEEFI